MSDGFQFNHADFCYGRNSRAKSKYDYVSYFIPCTSLYIVWYAEGSPTPTLQYEHTPESLPEQGPSYLKYYELVAGSRLLPRVLKDLCWQKVFDDLNSPPTILLVPFDPLYVVG